MAIIGILTCHYLSFIACVIGTILVEKFFFSFFSSEKFKATQMPTDKEMVM